MENIDIRKYIIDNFKDDNEEKIKDSIETTIKFKDEDALIGLGVLFEILWNNMTEEEKQENLSKLRTGIKNLANTNS
ncbi:MAG: small acid-soluble spore protein SspI [Bacilli bacterium]|nr:small acid-soluble spore protein SspI [Bacilli bacterium]